MNRAVRGLKVTVEWIIKLPLGALILGGASIIGLIRGTSMSTVVDGWRDFRKLISDTWASDMYYVATGTYE